MPQRGFVVEQNPLNIVTIRQFLEDLTAGIFAWLLLVTIKSLCGTLLFNSSKLLFKDNHKGMANGENLRKLVEELLVNNSSWIRTWS